MTDLLSLPKARCYSYHYHYYYYYYYYYHYRGSRWTQPVGGAAHQTLTPTVARRVGPPGSRLRGRSTGRGGCTHRVHGPGEQVSVLAQHVGHHEGGQLRVGVGVEQAVVLQGVEGVARLMLHQVQQGGVGVVGGRDGRDLVVLVPGRPAAASALAGVVLHRETEERRGGAR